MFEIISNSMIGIYYAGGVKNVNPLITHIFLIKKRWLGG